jgi:hypothetical protein
VTKKQQQQKDELESMHMAWRKKVFFKEEKMEYSTI